jgi:hypothetical protein
MAEFSNRGQLDGIHEHLGDARAEILAELVKFAIHGLCEGRCEWWARRSNEADMEMRFRVEPRTATTGYGRVAEGPERLRKGAPL